MELKEAKCIAERCTHYGMCKIDFLATGICPSGVKSKYVSYYPQGRMEIVNALADGIVPVTERLVDIARTCTLCGICDKQCYFTMELKPMKVMEALKEYIESYLRENKPIEKPEEDQVLRDLRKVVGHEWATNDPAILVAYSGYVRANMRWPRLMPGYVVMPESTQEVVETIRVANKYKVPVIVRSTGQQEVPYVLVEGIVIDVGRMKKIEINPEKWTATIQAGVTAFDLQKEASKYGMIANVAEPAACVPGNIICTALCTIFAHAYGLAAEHFVDAEIVTFDGKAFRLSDNDAPNLFNPTRSVPPKFLPGPPGICTEMMVKLYPTTGDEEGIFIPFSNFDEAIAMLREIGRRRIGIGAALLSDEYFSVFATPTFDASENLKEFLRNKMGIEYLVMVLGDKYAIRTIKEIAEVWIDQALARILILSTPQLHGSEGIELLSHAEVEEPYKVLLKEEMRPLWEMIFSPSPDNIAEAVDEDLKDFFRELYTRPEMTDIFWLNKFRFVSSRMGRNHMVYDHFSICPLENEAIRKICTVFKTIADKHGLRNHWLGNITPIEYGKRATLEYDYYYDGLSKQERKDMDNAQAEALEMKERLLEEITGYTPHERLFFQGLCRAEIMYM